MFLQVKEKLGQCWWT